jgi:hypothetical protein
MGGGGVGGTGSDPGWQAIAAMNGQNLMLQQGPLQAAQQRETQAIQSSLSDDTLNLIKMFGARAAMSGANVSAPFTAPGGGFATPFLTPAGGLIGARS